MSDILGSAGAQPGSIILGGSGSGASGVVPPAGVTGLTSLTAGYVTKQGDSAEEFLDTLTYSNGAVVDLTGSTVAFIMRNLSSAAPVMLTGTGQIQDALSGVITYQPSAQDASTSGLFMANWIVTFSNGQTMTFPTVGYITVSIEENLSASSVQQLVSLPDLKDHLNIGSSDRQHDAKLTRWINGVRPIVENIVGPVIVQQFEEWHDGGGTHITLDHRPSTGYGTTPVLILLGISEYNGPIEWVLPGVASPDRGTIYSHQVDVRRGRIVRRTAGGGVQPFPAGPQAVHVIYQAGQAQVPGNVYEATLELARVNYQTSQPVGRGRRSVADEFEMREKPMGFFVPGSVKELLAPTRRHPSLA